MVLLCLFLIEDFEGKTNVVPFFRACQLPYPKYDIQEYGFFRKTNTYLTESLLLAFKASR